MLLGIVFADPLVAALAPGFEKEAGKAELTVLLTRVMMPFLPLVSFAAVAMGMLNAQERFGIPALSPALFNLVAIVWAARCGRWACRPSRSRSAGRSARWSAGWRSSPFRCPRCGGSAGASGRSGRRATRRCCGWPG